MQCLQYYLQYFHNNPKQQVVTGKQKNNFNGKFKIEPVKTYHLGFIVKMLQKYCGPLLKNCPNKQISLKSQIKRLIVIF